MTDTAPHPANTIPEPHLHLVYAAALRQTRDPHLAADITQAVFVLLARRIHQGRPPKETHMAGWLLNVTRFAVKESRRAATRRAYHEKKSAELRPASTPSPDAAIDANPITPHLDAALLALPATDRELLIRRYLQSEPVHELAATLRIPPNTAAKRITRALDRLRTLLQRRGITAPAALLTATLTTQSLIRTPPALAAQILSAPAVPTALAKTLATKLFLLKLQTALAVAALVIVSFTGAFLLQQHRHTIASPVATANPIQSPPSATARGPSAPTPEQLHTRALLYQLRYSVITTATTEETYAAIRDLVSIGKPAVPELCAELDRATSDSELRALTFTLRAINDPRAVPALIRALPKTPVLVSDFGNAVADRELWQFITDHRLPGTPPETYPDIATPRANRQITAALETVANATIAKDSVGGARSDAPGDIARAQALRQRDADRWQDWWSNHWQQFLSQKDVDALHLPPAPGDPVEAAGIAAFGPLFPAGHSTHLGPVHDITLPGLPLFDQQAFIDLTTGRTFSMLQDVADPAMSGNTFYFWLHQLNIDAQCVQLIRKTSTPHSATQNIYRLQSTFTRVWCVDNSRWDSLESEVRTGKTINPGDEGPHGNFMRYHPDTGLPYFDDQYPLTFLFITAGNTRGIIQLLGTSENPGGIHFRYRLFEGISPGASPVHSPQCTNASSQPIPDFYFTPEKTVTLAAPSSKEPSAVDLASSRTYAPDIDLINPEDHAALIPETDSWLASHHVDFIVEPAAKEDPNLYALRCVGTALFPCTSAAYQKLSPADVASIARRRLAPATPQFIYADFEHQSPATWAFKTRSGTTGLLQITAATPTTLTLHYKLLKAK